MKNERAQAKSGLELAPNGFVVCHCSCIPLARWILLRLPPECADGPLLVRVPILDRQGLALLSGFAAAHRRFRLKGFMWTTGNSRLTLLQTHCGEHPAPKPKPKTAELSCCEVPIQGR